MKTAKFWVGLVGAIATSLLTVFGPDSRVGQVLVVVVALVTALGVYLVPNAEDEQAAYLRAQDAKRP